jgi:hypothetical protein
MTAGKVEQASRHELPLFVVLASVISLAMHAPLRRSGAVAQVTPAV